MTLDDALTSCPLMAILRGVTPKEVRSIGEALFDSGIRAIEIPLNSPDALTSIEILANLFADRAVVGAGTVMTEQQVREVHGAGGQLVVSPNLDPTVLEAALELSMTVCPGVLTPTEMFYALKSGARHLKVFPASTLGTDHVRSVTAVLPPEAHLLAVGGVTPDTAKTWLSAGCAGLGLGSNLYSPGASASDVAARAATFVNAVSP